MHPPRDVDDALGRDGVYLAPMRPTDGDREFAHHLCALISMHHRYRAKGRHWEPTMTPVMGRIMDAVHEAMYGYFNTVHDGVPETLDPGYVPRPCAVDAPYFCLKAGSPFWSDAPYDRVIADGDSVYLQSPADQGDLTLETLTCAERVDVLKRLPEGEKLLAGPPSLTDMQMMHAIRHLVQTHGKRE